jgi:predicted RNase H-like nuclease (RuvC/YqgF family)
MLGNGETSTETVQKVATAMLAMVQDNNWLASENTRLIMESERLTQQNTQLNTRIVELQELVTGMEKTIADQLYRNNVRRDTIVELQCRVSDKCVRITELESVLEKVRGMYKAL